MVNSKNESTKKSFKNMGDFDKKSSDFGEYSPYLRNLEKNLLIAYPCLFEAVEGFTQAIAVSD
ncbi:hypothetical protein TUMEXPCC7403_24385 [Tumidithrix helvetica PCC 7403]